jgi:hypothetical protein
MALRLVVVVPLYIFIPQPIGGHVALVLTVFVIHKSRYSGD